MVNPGVTHLGGCRADVTHVSVSVRQPGAQLRAGASCAVSCCGLARGYLTWASASSPAVMMAKEKPPITVVGDVGGRIAIIVV